MGTSVFLGRNLITRLLKATEGNIYVLCHDQLAHDSLAAYQEEMNVAPGRLVAIGGVTPDEEGLGLSASDITMLKGNVSHFFHLAAIYDLNATAEAPASRQ